MSALTQNEMERLRSERDAMKSQLDAAVEREAALAVYALELRSMTHRLATYPHDCDDDTYQEAQKLISRLPNVSALNRRYLIKQAEVLEEMERNVKSMHPKSSHVGIGVHIGIEAKKLRQQAEELTP